MAYKKQPSVVRDRTLPFPEQDYSNAEAIMYIHAAHQARTAFNSSTKLFSGITLPLEAYDKLQEKSIVESVVKAGQIMQEVLSLHYLLTKGAPEERFSESFWHDIVIGDDGTVYWTDEMQEGPYSVHLMRCLDQLALDCQRNNVHMRWSVQPDRLGKIPEQDDFTKARPGSRIALIYTVGKFDLDTVYDHHELILTRIIDAICSLHLVGMRVKCSGLVETRSFDCALTEMWWHLVRQMDIGTPGICEACGRFFLAQPARSKKRKFCCSACRQWRLANPGSALRELELLAN